MGLCPVSSAERRSAPSRVTPGGSVTAASPERLEQLERNTQHLDEQLRRTLGRVAGASLRRSKFSGPVAQAARVNYKTAALWAALVLGVALLGWSAWFLTRQMKR